MGDLKLYLVTDRSLAKGRDIVGIVEMAVQGGVTMVQLREKTCPAADFIELARKTREMLSRYNVPLIINDRIDVAIASGAEGLHLGQKDIPWNTARSILGQDRIIGLSVETIDQAEKANSMEVDYIAVSPVFSTPTKADTAEPFGLEGTREVMSLTRHHAVAIGGINLSNAADVLNTGIHGIAVVSAIVSADDPKKAARELKNIV